MNNVLNFDYSCIFIFIFDMDLNGQIISLKFGSYAAELRIPGEVDCFYENT